MLFITGIWQRQIRDKFARQKKHNSDYLRTLRCQMNVPPSPFINFQLSNKNLSCNTPSYFRILFLNYEANNVVNTYRITRP